MDLKAALILTFLLSTFEAYAIPTASEVSESLHKNDWPALVALLKPMRGQNFEQDFILAKAYLSLERRTDAIKILNELAKLRRDERVLKLRELAYTQFFSQETANLYYEAIRLISQRHWAEAKEKLGQAQVKEPGHGLVLLRLIQVELFLGKKTALEEHLKQAQQEVSYPQEWKIFLAKHALDREDLREAYRVLFPLREEVVKKEIPAIWWMQILSKLGRTEEVIALQNRTLKDYPDWSLFYLASLQLLPQSSTQLKTESPNKQMHLKKNIFLNQLQKNLKDKTKFIQNGEIHSKRDQYLWDGYIDFEVLQRELEAMLNVKPSLTN